MSARPAVRASAPGKVILSGEHAAVYGRPALAAAVNRYAAARVSADRDLWLSVQSPFGRMDIGSEAEGDALCREVLQRYAAFDADELPIGEVLGSPQRFPQMAWLLARRNDGARVPGGRRLEIETDLPLGAGMGSSAAIAAALTLAIAADAGLALSPAELAARASEVERLQHGRPSGIDVHMAVHGGTVWFQRDRPPQPIALPETAFVLANTGIPESGTGECVAQVRRRHESRHATWSAFEAVGGRIRDALAATDGDALIGAVRENHRLLAEIGVVPEPVRAWIAGLEAAGGAGKVCGAGSIRGVGGGVVWVVGATACREARSGPYPILQLEVEPRGAHLIE